MNSSKSMYRITAFSKYGRIKDFTLIPQWAKYAEHHTTGSRSLFAQDMSSVSSYFSLHYKRFLSNISCLGWGVLRFLFAYSVLVILVWRMDQSVSVWSHVGEHVVCCGLMIRLPSRNTNPYLHFSSKYVYSSVGYTRLSDSSVVTWLVKYISEMIKSPACADMMANRLLVIRLCIRTLLTSYIWHQPRFGRPHDELTGVFS